MTKKNTEIPVMYKLRTKDQKWLAYDMVVEGVSLVNNYRTQFSDILAKSSFEGLMKKLREKMPLNSAEEGEQGNDETPCVSDTTIFCVRRSLGARSWAEHGDLCAGFLWSQRMELASIQLASLKGASTEEKGEAEPVELFRRNGA